MSEDEFTTIQLKKSTVKELKASEDTPEKPTMRLSLTP